MTLLLFLETPEALLRSPAPTPTALVPGSYPSPVALLSPAQLFLQGFGEGRGAGGVQDMPPPNMAPWWVEYFLLKEYKNSLTFP